MKIKNMACHEIKMFVYHYRNIYLFILGILKIYLLNNKVFN